MLHYTITLRIKKEKAEHRGGGFDCRFVEVYNAFDIMFNVKITRFRSPYPEVEIGRLI